MHEQSYRPICDLGLLYSRLTGLAFRENPSYRDMMEVIADTQATVALDHEEEIDEVHLSIAAGRDIALGYNGKRSFLTMHDRIMDERYTLHFVPDDYGEELGDCYASLVDVQTNIGEEVALAPEQLRGFAYDVYVGVQNLLTIPEFNP